MVPSTFRVSLDARTTSRIALTAAIALGCAGAPVAVSAQTTSREVVQQLPSAEELALTDALQILARDPRNTRALLTAGRSTLVLDDIDAALGFFSRARDADPGSAEALAGLAAVQVHKQDPATAIRLFESAGEAALRHPAIAADHGLAYDLVGDQARAQAIYRAALAREASEEITRRLSLSQAIAGDRQASESTLLPQLQRQNKSAWRTRAFALAILGATDEAIAVTAAVMPAGLAREMEPFIRVMPRLTRAQQAAAANLGNFPASGEIGRDTADVADFDGGSAPAAPRRRRAGDGLVPQGEALGTPRSDRPVADRNGVVVAEQGPTLAGQSPPRPGGVDFDSAFDDVSRPDDRAAAASGAVDVTGITPARAKTADPPPPADPARIWVQLGVGRDIAALAFDWRRLQRRHQDLQGRDAYSAPLGQTNRMVTGPFATRAEALALVNALKEAEHDSLVWRSGEGEEVALLPER